MALSPDDKLLGEKVHYYCSSSEDEEESDNEGSGDEAQAAKTQQQSKFIPEPDLKDYTGHSTNTGPKGVINDWRRFKQLENEKREAQEAEKKQLIKKLTLTCRSHLDDERERQKDEQFLEGIERELADFEDEFLKEYRRKRIEEMRKAVEAIPKFGKVKQLNSEKFVDEIDKENPHVTIIIHIYEENARGCEAMNGSLICLAQEYPTVKFCKIKASDAKVSFNFAANGVPALLVYKKRELIGNFVRMTDDLGDDFFATDVEGFLHEHGLLPTTELSAALLNTQELQQAEDSGSDFDVD